MTTAREAALEKALNEIASHDLFGLRDPYRLMLQRIIDSATHALARDDKPVEPYPNDVLTDISKQLLDDHGLTLAQIKNLAADLHGECENINEQRSEDYWSSRSAPDDSGYRRDMIAAGRGHLLG